MSASENSDPAATSDYAYDAFVSYSEQDRAWVEGWLLPRLEAAGISACIAQRDFDVGAPALENVERAIAASRHTLLVLTDAWLESEWAAFEALLAQMGDPAGRHQRVLPLLLSPCEPPQHLLILTAADFTRPECWEAQIERLLAAIRDARRLPDVGPPLLQLGAVADRLLAALPLDHLPEVMPLPKGSRMPLSRNPLFVGREADLRSLAAALKGGGTTAIGQIAATTGLGGIGKTQLASEFAHRYGQFFAGGVFWLSFADAGAVPDEIAACGGAGYMELRPDFAALPPNDQVRLVLAAWQSPLPRLLVFDNCEDETALAAWRPTSGGCRVLVTSRRARWDPSLDITTLPLDVLRRDESIALLRKFRPDLPMDHPDLNAIAAELGGLPLALHLAGSFLKLYQADMQPAEYLAELRTESLLAHPSLLGEDLTYSPTNHPLHVGRTFALSYDRLDRTSPIDALALDLLARAAYFAHGEPIPRDLLVRTVDPSRALSARQATRALRRLAALGLIDDTALKLHRLLAAFAQHTPDDLTAQRAVEQVLSAEMTRLNGEGRVGSLTDLQRHLYAVTNAAMSRTDAEAANLCSAFGYTLYLFGRYNEARPYLERSFAIRQQIFGMEHSKTASSLYLLALCSQMQCSFPLARELYEQALSIRERVLGPEDINTLKCRSDLGYLLFLMGRHIEAVRQIRQALAIRHRLFGLDDPGVARNLNDLGYIMLHRGRYRASYRYLSLALAIRERVLPSPHIGTAQTLNNLGETFYAQARYAEAEQHHARALAMREAMFVGNHTDIAESLYNLGRVAHVQARLDQARSLLERALEMNRLALNQPHRETARTLSGLGCFLRDQGEYEQADGYLHEALAAQRATMGPANFEVAQSLNDLGLLRLAQGSYDDAQAYLHSAMRIYREIHEPRHPGVAISLHGLGRIELLRKAYAQAATTLDQAREMCERSEGALHPDTASILISLGELAQAQGDRLSARLRYHRALASYEQVFGADHPITQAAQKALRALDDLTPHQADQVE